MEGDALCAGTLTATVNFNLDFSDWSGALWGTAVVELDSVDGGYIQSFTAHWLIPNPLDPSATDIWEVRYVGRGYGAMAGWQIRGTLHEANHGLVYDEGVAFEPGD